MALRQRSDPQPLMKPAYYTTSEYRPSNDYAGAYVHYDAHRPNEIFSPELEPPPAFDDARIYLNENLKVSRSDAYSMVLWKHRTPLKKITPSSTVRYQRAKTVDTFPLRFEPEQALDDHLASPDLVDWTPHIHPEGSVYYHNPSRHVVTEANLRKPSVRDRITYWMAEFEAASCASLVLPKDYELFLELDSEEDQCSYYVVDHERQAVFWLDAANTEDLNLPDVSSHEHLRLKLEEQYWVHLEYFPGHRKLPELAEQTLVGILTHAWGDQTTSALSTAPYSAEQCKNFLVMLDRFQVVQTAIGRDVLGGLEPLTVILLLPNISQGLPDQDGYKTCLIARLMNELLHSRFINLYGHPESARLARNQSTLPVSTEREPRVLRILCSIVLYQYQKELKDLKELWVDNIVYTEHWRAFLESRLQEWKSLSLLSAMLLLVDTLLVLNYQAHPSSLFSKLPLVRTGHMSATMSLLLSMSTMIVGVTTIIIHQPYSKTHASEASVYLDNASHATLGLQPLAVVLSLPRSLFLWALVTGGIALLSFSFQVLDSWSIVFIGIFAVFLCALLVWVIRFFQVRSADLNEPEGLLTGKFALFGGFPSRFFGKQKETLDTMV